MDYYQTIDYIHKTPKFAKSLGNAPLEKLLGLLKNPEKKLKFIHIAGTNGKGSTASMTASVLKKAGFKTGLFTSPFIERFNERIQIDGIQIPDDTLIRLTAKVKTIMEEHDAFVSEFALITAIAFLYFSEENCDIVVLETGLGGRLDATNVIENPLVCVITSIGLDHTQYLGDTVSEIAKEKCGIIKQNVPVVLYPIQKDGVFETVKNFCDDFNAPLTIPKLPKIMDSYMVYENKNFTLSLRGSYQYYNAVVVVEIIKLLRTLGFSISDADLEYGLSHTQWIARFEFLTPDLVIDGSHNPDGVLELKKDLLALERKVTLVIAMMSDKEFKKCVEIFSEITDSVIVTRLDMPRCCDPKELALEFKRHGIRAQIIDNTKNAVKAAVKTNNLTCICGSLYLAGEVRRNFSSLNIE